MLKFDIMEQNFRMFFNTDGARPRIKMHMVNIDYLLSVCNCRW